MISTSATDSLPMAGDRVTITCSVTLDEGVSGTLNFQWTGPGQTPNPTASSTVGQVVTSRLILSAIKTSQAGVYTCSASLSGHSVSSTIDITVEGKITTCVS